MSDITITIPEISPQAIADLETLNTQAVASELDAVRMIREKYAPLAKQNGYIKIGNWQRGDGRNWSENKDYFYTTENGRKVKGLLCWENFHQPNTGQWDGTNSGDRLFLMEDGRWLRLVRDGYWSAYQGSSAYWSCDPDGFGDDNFPEFSPKTAEIRVLSDEQVADLYDFADLLSDLSKALQGLVQRIPQRMTKLQQRAELAQRVISCALNPPDPSRSEHVEL